VGKTRLSRETLRRAAERGCLCLTGHCYEMEGTAPFAPLIETTEQAVRLAPRAVRNAMGDVAGDLSLVVPGIRRAYPDIPPAPVVAPEQQRQLVFSAFLEYVRRLAAEAPSVVLLDDLHWADEPSLQLLSFIVPHLDSMRLLVLGTYRDVELDVARPFAKTLETLLRQRLATRITLRRLNESGVQQMLTAMQGSAPPSSLAKVVFSETEGNPFFVEEVYQHLAEEGKLFDEHGRWKEGLRADAIDVPEGVRLVIGRRLERVGEVARKVLIAAAVIGRTFSLDLLQSIVDVPEDDVLDALEAAERAQLVAPQPSSREARYEFVHELIRSTLMNGLSLPRRQRMHVKVADALERLRANALESHASVLAHHFYQAGAAADVDRTLKYMTLAVKRAIAAGAFEDALDLLDQIEALEIDPERAFIGRLREDRGKALIGLGRASEAMAPFEEAFASYAAVGHTAGVAWVSRALAGILMFQQGSFLAGTEPLERALEILPSSALAERILVGAQLTVNLQAHGLYDEAARQLEDVVSAGARVADDHIRGIVHLTQMGYAAVLGEVAIPAAHGREVLRLLDPAALWERTSATMQTALLELTAGRVADADVAASQFARLSRAGLPGSHFVIEWLPPVIALMRTGNVEAFVAITRSAKSQWAFHQPARLSVGLLYLGQVNEALGLMRSAIGQSALFHEGILEGNLFAATALVAPGQAWPLFAAVEPKLPAADRRNLLGSWQALSSVVPALALIGAADQCGALYPQALEAIKRGGVAWDLMMAVGPSTSQLCAAIAAHAAGFHDRSTEHFDIAAREARDMPHRLLQPAVTYWRGRTLLDAGHSSDVARGRAMIEAATADFESLKMPVYVELARRTLME
jgi:tetratricopeptide (TPR) repeat protein